MQFLETELIFTQASPLHFAESRRLSVDTETSKNSSLTPVEVLGIKLRLGNAPLVYNLEKLSGSQKNNASSFLNPNKDHYLIVHAIGVSRVYGKAKVEELHYFAEAAEPTQLQTIDLIPNTKFKELFSAGLDFEGSLSASGETSVNIPVELSESLIPEIVSVGGFMQLQLSGDARFAGKFSFHIYLPVVQASGIASNTCSWILNPNASGTPLLGDQLLVQSISVPKGTRKINYKITGVVKADKGLLWKQQLKKTPEYDIEVSLD